MKKRKKEGDEYYFWLVFENRKNFFDNRVVVILKGICIVY